MLELTVPQIEKLEEKLKDIPEKIPVVTARAMNRTIAHTRTKISTAVRQTYHVKHGAILDTIKIKNAYPADLNVELKSKGSAIELMKFKVRPSSPQPRRKKAVTASVKKGAGGSVYNGFVAQLRNPKYADGQLNVFTRVSRARHPLQGRYGPSIPQMLGNKDVVTKATEESMEKLEERLNHEIGYVLNNS